MTLDVIRKFGVTGNDFCEMFFMHCEKIVRHKIQSICEQYQFSEDTVNEYADELAEYLREIFEDYFQSRVREEEIKLGSEEGLDPEKINDIRLDALAEIILFDVDWIRESWVMDEKTERPWYTTDTGIMYQKSTDEPKVVLPTDEKFVLALLLLGFLRGGYCFNAFAVSDFLSIYEIFCSKIYSEEKLRKLDELTKTINEKKQKHSQKMAENAKKRRVIRNYGQMTCLLMSYIKWKESGMRKKELYFDLCDGRDKPNEAFGARRVKVFLSWVSVIKVLCNDFANEIKDELPDGVSNDDLEVIKNEHLPRLKEDKLLERVLAI